MRGTEDTDRVQAWVRADFGIRLHTLERVTRGLDLAADLWLGVAADGARYAVKWTGGGSRAGLVVPAMLADAGVPGVAAPLPARDTGRPWSDRAGRRLAVLPWLAGRPAPDGTMTEPHWRSFGALLARVHATGVSDRVAAWLPREQHRGHRRWLSDVDRLATRLAHPGPRPGDPLTRDATALWHSAAGAVSAVRDRAEALGRTLCRRAQHSVLCHGDPHRGNILTEPDGRVWLIDWDDAVLAPPERDLLFVLGGVLPFAPVGPREQSWFFAGYGPARPDPDRLAYYRCVRALEDLTELVTQVVDVGGGSAEDRARALDLARGVLSDTGLVRLALDGAPSGPGR